MIHLFFLLVNCSSEELKKSPISSSREEMRHSEKSPFAKEARSDIHLLRALLIPKSENLG